MVWGKKTFHPIAPKKMTIAHLYWTSSDNQWSGRCDNSQVRVMRILRIFKLVRHFAGLQSLFYTLQQAYQVPGVPNYFTLIFFPGVGSPCLGCARRYSHLLVSGLPCQLLIKWITLYTFNLSLFYPFQVYFAERENQISLGDLEAVNCTGWVDGPNNEYQQFVIKTSSCRPFYENKLFGSNSYLNSMFFLSFSCWCLEVKTQIKYFFLFYLQSK